MASEPKLAHYQLFRRGEIRRLLPPRLVRHFFDLVLARDRSESRSPNSLPFSWLLELNKRHTKHIIQMYQGMYRYSKREPLRGSVYPAHHSPVNCHDGRQRSTSALHSSDPDPKITQRQLLLLPQLTPSLLSTTCVWAYLARKAAIQRALFHCSLAVAGLFAEIKRGTTTCLG